MIAQRGVRYGLAALLRVDGPVATHTGQICASAVVRVSEAAGWWCAGQLAKRPQRASRQAGGGSGGVLAEV